VTIVPISFAEASAFVARHHRHHMPSVGHKFSVAVEQAGVIVGVAVVGRPVAKGNQDGWTLEVTRLATDGTRNACSMLYRAAWRSAAAMGYRRLITYTLVSERGASLRGAGFKLLGERRGGSWSRASRPRIDLHPLQEKLLWEVRA